MNPSDSSTDINPQISSARENLISQKRKFKQIKDIWYHFSKKGEQVECDYCALRLNKQKHSGTNPYWDHLKRCRMDKFNLAKGNKPNKKFKITKDGTLALSAAETYTKEGFQRALLEGFIKNCIPFNVVDNEYFRKPFLLLSKDADLFCATTLKRNMMTWYTSMKSSKKKEFADIDGKISFTTDCWTSPNNMSFMGITAH